MGSSRCILWIMLMVVYFAFSSSVSGQRAAEEILKGYWEGAFISGNSQQPIQIQFYQEEDNWKCLQIMEEWHPQFGEFVQAVTFQDQKAVTFNTGYGTAKLTLDETNLELIGMIEESEPSMSLHLKKVPPPPPPDYEVTEVRIPAQGIELYGHLHQPIWQKAKTAIILAGGRGCYAGSTKYNLYGKILRSHGVAVLAFHKRGNGKSGGNCDAATIEDLALDLQACRRFLKEQYPALERIGVLGSSAGGWVMLRSHEMKPFDFLIGVVGPSTSVYDQQIQSMQYGIDYFKLAPEVKDPLLEYTRMMFEAKPRKRQWKRFQELLVLAEAQGWKKLLEGTDIPPSQEGIDSLWVRRHSYDPGPMLNTISVPYLAIYGEKDWVVPHQENVALLEGAFNGERKDLLTTVVAPTAQHGTEVDASEVALPGGQTYWRFFRISPHVMLSITSFLEQHQLIRK